MVRDRPALPDGITWKDGIPTGNSVSGKENPANMLRFFTMVTVPEDMPVISGMPCVFLSSTRELQTWEYVCVEAYGKGRVRTKETK